MLAYFKINQVHFYAKFSTAQQNIKQWYHALEWVHDYFNFFQILFINIKFPDEFFGIDLAGKAKNFILNQISYFYGRWFDLEIGLK